MLHLRQGAAVCGVFGDELLFLGQLHGRGNDLVQVPHRLGAQALALFFAFNPFYSAVAEQLLVEFL